jgi:hypothetical protein
VYTAALTCHNLVLSALAAVHSRMAAALHSIDSLALFPRPWAHQGDPSLAEMWAQLQGRAAKQQNSGRGPLSGDSTSWDLAASPVNLHPQAAQPAHSILSQPSGPHAHHALHVTLPLEAPTGSTTTMSPRQQQQQQQAVSPRNKGASLKYGSGGGGAAAAAAGGSPDEGVQRQRRQGRLSMTGGGAGGGRRQSIAGDLPGAGVSARKRLASQEVAKTRLGKRSTVLRGGQHGAVRRSLAGNEGAAGGRGGGSPDTGHPPSLLGGRSSWMSAVNQVVGLGVMLEEEDEEGAGYDPRDLKLLDAWKVAHHTKPTGAWWVGGWAAEVEGPVGGRWQWPSITACSVDWLYPVLVVLVHSAWDSCLSPYILCHTLD